MRCAERQLVAVGNVDTVLLIVFPSLYRARASGISPIQM